jgi:hypothetical protein
MLSKNHVSKSQGCMGTCSNPGTLVGASSLRRDAI